MAVIASAPGKVLMTGGYLILERPNAGIVLSTNARFCAIIKPLYNEIIPGNWWWGWTDVKLTSPQMARETMYKLSLKHLLLQPVSYSDSRNPFVEYAVHYAVAAAHATFDENKRGDLHNLLLLGNVCHASLDITILGCNEFYSYRNQIEAHGLPLSPGSLASLPPFVPITFNADGSSDCGPEVAKTGLGSSAAMTTAVVAALLHYVGLVRLPLSTNTRSNLRERGDGLDVVHIVSQTAHCIAQGKVGSGFDVSSAVYGSQRYIKFSPQVLSSVQSTVQGMSVSEAIGDVLKANWDHEWTRFSLPPLMTLLLGEPGSGGSSTPSMVGAVKKWQKAEPENSLETWIKLSEANTALEFYFKTLTNLAANNFVSYKSAINKCSTFTSEKWPECVSQLNEFEVVKSLQGARDAMFDIRLMMRKMGEAAGIPIEPESQTRLLDKTMNTERVLLAGVPGAGGFDAVFAITLGDDYSSITVANVWSSLNILALLVREDPRGVCLESNDPRSAEITNGISNIDLD